MLRTIRFLLFAFAVLPRLSAGLDLPSIFSNGMVLQRQRPVPVWGTAQPGSGITVEFAGQKKSAVTDAGGRWKIDLDEMEASSDSREMKISSSLKSEITHVTFSGVLVGEVWLCSGQSNMAFPMEQTENGEAVIAAATRPLIHLYKTPAVFARVPQGKITASWTDCSPKTVRGFSAVAYYFGSKLSQELDVPVGLLQSAWGGTRIEPWTPPCGFEGIDSLADIRERIDPMPALNGDPKQDRQFPTAIYNGMIHAHIPFAIRGVIWYQGESNRGDGMLYVDKTRALLNGWRGLWGYDFPFYFVQIAPFRQGDKDPFITPLFWEAQGEIVKQIPNTGMVVISDAATLKDIHPPNKEIPGTRLALLALSNTYERNIVCTGPQFYELKRPPLSPGRLEILFSSAKGLTTRDGKKPDWFEVAGEDDIFKPAQAVINGRSIFVSSPDVEKPVTVRFAWHKLATPNLMNGAGLPAPAFRAAL